MIGFASIQGGAPASVGALTDHLLNLTLNPEHGRVADYYARTGRPLSEEERTAGLFRAEEGPSVESVAVLRPDLHPIVARGLSIEQGSPLTREQVNGLLAGRRADGEKVVGKVYAKARSLGIDPRTGEQRTSAPIGSYDFCPTPDKSVSVAWAFAEPAQQAAIYTAHLEAARDAVRYIGSEGPTVRNRTVAYCTQY